MIAEVSLEVSRGRTIASRSMPIARVRAERRKDAFGAGNAPETRAATRRRRALTRNDPRARLLPHQTRRRACENHVPCPRCTRASGPPWCLTRCQNRKKRGFVRPRNRPGSAPPSRSRRPRPRLEHPSRRLSLRTSENAGRRRRYPRRASRGACFCSPVPTPIRTSPPRAQQRFFVSFFFARVCGSVPFLRPVDFERENRNSFRSGLHFG